MRIVVVVKHAGFLRYIQTQVETLLERGHAIHIAIQDSPIEDEDGLLDLLTQRWPAVSVSSAVSRRDSWAPLALSLRKSLDYFHYLHPDYGQAEGLKLRRHLGSSRLGGAVQRVLRATALDRSVAFSRGVLGLLRGLYASIPAAPEIVASLNQLDADLVMVTGLVWPRSAQADYVRAARRLGKPTAYVVNSWDNLTNKGDIKMIPDRVYVWNEEQRREAREHHGVADAEIVVTGAPLFDRWYARELRESRADFCRRMGLPDDGPFILYACSSPSIAPLRSEVGHFQNWLLNIRNSDDPRLRDINVLLRPHPYNAQAWGDFETRDPRLVAHPRHGRWVVREADRDDYFHALAYSSAVVGLNTSAMIEAAILGTPTFCVRSDKFASMQEGTLHFHYLQQHGVVDIRSRTADHLVALAEGLADPGGGRRAPLAGVAALVRPRGSEQPATPIATDALEAQAGGAVAPRRNGLPIWRPVLWWGVHAHAALRSVVGTVKPAGKDKYKRKTMSRESDRPSAAGRMVDWLFGKAVVWGARHLASPALRGLLDEQLNAAELDRFAAVEKAIADACEGDGLIFCGPWLSEVGFEVLYWIPFLRWLRKRMELPKARLVVISRGGTRWWYGGVLGRYVDVFDFYTPAEFRRLNLSRAVEVGHQKQTAIGELDHEIYRAVAERLGVERYTVLHPWVMFRLFTRYWTGAAGPQFMARYTRFAPINVAAKELEKACKTLPARFTAVKFYFRESFPDTPENRALVQRLIASLAERGEVVVLGSGVRVDDHADFAPEAAARVHRLDHMADPARNLEVQTAVLARADSFVGTYGGLAYVAGLLGKTCICFETLPQHNQGSHTELALRQIPAAGGELHILQPHDLALFEQLTRRAGGT